MRLHELSATAFGPFAGTVHIDFEALAESGLFLLTGPTGAGKSSVLDAVCFALYGQVPGDRSTARRLRCDVAPDGVAPRVFLDVSIGDRRFHLTRSPAWERPKKRGTGLTTQQASVLVEEIVEGASVHLTNRLDEAGQLVSDLLGMTVSQFTQVALLPQGRFQDFLRARSEERHHLLQRLFRTHRFEQVEQWLRQHRTTLRRRSESQEDRVAGLVHRLGEASRRPLDDHDACHGPDGRGRLAELAESGALSRWAGECERLSTRAVETARTELTTAVGVDHSAAAALADARALAQLRTMHTAATKELAALQADADNVCALRTAAQAARRARPVAVVQTQVDRASDRGDAAASRLAEALTVAHELIAGGDDPVAVQAALDTARGDLGEARALQPRAEELSRLRDELAVAEEQLQGATERTSRLRREVEQAPLALAAAEAECRVVEESIRLLAAARNDATLLGERLGLLTEAEGVADQLDRARRDLHDAIDRHQELKQRWLELQEQRLSGMAAEIATALAVGDSCPVCGSCDHPHPASPTPGAPTATAEKAARKAAEDADVHRQAHDDHVHALEQRATALTTQAGDESRLTVETRLEATRERVAELEPVARREGAVRAAADQARATVATSTEELARARARHASLTTTRASLAERIGALDDLLSADLAGLPDVPSLVRLRQTTVDRLQAVAAAQREALAAEQALDETTADLAAVLADSGFDSAEAAVVAVLPSEVIDEHTRAVEAHDRARAAAAATLADPDVRAAGLLPDPGLPELAEAAEAASEARRAAEVTHRSCTERRDRITTLHTALRGALADWEPLRSDHAIAAGLSALVEGRSADNTLQMRLSAYVLSWRLGQVVAAANERLVRMTGHRYTLEHTTRRGAGESRGGLSLRIVDDWSGESRDPVTLSGGETFVVSLALALGLTDVVTQEAGGTHVGTLFVDEGFGSLDADTLDDVMDTLDTLREGGRVVGIVSHVPELRVRVPAQLRVAKARTGSTLETCHEIG